MSPRLQAALAGFDASPPLARAEGIPPSWYLLPEIAELETEVVFAHSWQPACRADQVANTGSYATAQIGRDPVAIVRDKAGELRAFANVCRHKASLILEGECGEADRLRCRYHGWTYDLEGRLRGLPEFDGVENFCREDNSLPQFAVAEWAGYVWVHILPPERSLENCFNPLPAWWADRPALTQLHWAERRTYSLACNWKVYVDNYLDGGYHVNTVHPALAGVLDYKNYRTELYERVSLQSSPLVPSGDAETDSVRTGTEAAYWWLYPNVMMNYYSGVMDVNIVRPIAVDRCEVIFDFYFADQTPDAIQRSVTVGERVQDEDVRVCENVQVGLNSRFARAGRFSARREAGEYHFHRLLAADLTRTPDEGTE